MTHTVLLVDDDPAVLDGLARALRREPYRILRAGSADEAARVLSSEPVDLIVCDEQMPGMSGSEFLARVAREHPQVMRIMLTGNPSLPAALRAINEGRVYHFFTKPCNEIDLALKIREALELKDRTSTPAPTDDAAAQPGLAEQARIARRLRGILGCESLSIDPSGTDQTLHPSQD
jgi:DNA-binding NtrC family response regulator